MRESTVAGRFSKLLAVALCTLLLGVCTSASAQSLTFATFEAPGAGTASDQGTFAASINNSGVGTGYYVDSYGNPHGYLRARDGTITTIDIPGPEGALDECGTTPSSINSGGAITGADCFGGGFLRPPDGTFTLFNQSFPSGINDSGAITGNFPHTGYLVRVFLRAPDGTFTTFDAPGASANGLFGTQAYSINARGAIVGFYQDTNGGFHGFLRAANGTFTTLDAPGAARGTFAFSINQAGAIAGSYWDSSTVSHGFVTIPQSPLHNPPHGRHHGRGHRDRD